MAAFPFSEKFCKAVGGLHLQRLAGVVRGELASDYGERRCVALLLRLALESQTKLVWVCKHADFSLSNFLNFLSSKETCFDC